MKMKFIMFLALMLTASMFNAQQTNKVLSIYWCGFSEGFCGDSNSDDVYHQATHVIMSYAIIDNDGDFSTGTFNSSIRNLISQWQDEGKKVLLSIGGDTTNISYAFSDASSLASQIRSVLNNNNLDGVDFEIKSYLQTPQQIINALSTYRNSLGSGKQIFLTCEQIGVYPSSFVPVPDLDEEAAYNYMVPVIRNTNNYDYIQVLVYGNEYLTAQGSTSQYVEAVYKGWKNDNQNYNIPNFQGVANSKLIIGVLASFKAESDNSPYYVTPNTLKTAINNLQSQGYNLKGIAVFDSNDDENNDYSISIAALEALGVTITEEGEDDNNNGDDGTGDDGTGDDGTGDDGTGDDGTGDDGTGDDGTGDDGTGDDEESVEGSCYIGQCGCPGSFKLSWCSDQSKPPSSFCQSGQSQCESCAGSWCPGSQDDSTDDGTGDDGTGDDDTDDGTGDDGTGDDGTGDDGTDDGTGDDGTDDGTGDDGTGDDGTDDGDSNQGTGVCFIDACGCPGNFKASWCTTNNNLGSGWCGQSSDNCEACSGVWCFVGDDIVDEIEDNLDEDQDGEEDETINSNVNKFGGLFLVVLYVIYGI